MEQKAPRRRATKAELTEILMGKFHQWLNEGLTPEQAIEKFTPKQYDFLCDQEVDFDQWLLTPEQRKAVSEVRKAQRTVKPGGYNKKYPEPKMNLYMSIVEHITAMGAEIIPKEKENFRDLDFTLDGTKYKIVLSNPRK